MWHYMGMCEEQGGGVGKRKDGWTQLKMIARKYT